jgi:type I restriction enzyme S subunit
MAATHGYTTTRGIETPPKRLKFIAPLRNERTEATSDHVDYLGLENIQPWTGKLLPSTTSENSEEDDSTSGTSNVFYSGDVLFGKLRPYLAKALHAGKDGVCSTELLVLKPQPDIHPRFLLYSMLSPDFVGQVDASTFGAKMPRANWEFIGSMKIPTPAYETQRLIADYLDRETARIDALVAEKEKMLALLEEKRAALISRAVARGLDPNVPLKPSGLDCLDEIPAHWGLWRLKHLGRVESGSGFPHDYQGNEGSELLFLKVSDMNLPGNEYRISASNNTVSREVARELSATVLPSGAVVYAKIGAALMLNKRRILQREACIDNNMSGFVPSRVTSEWAHAWLSILDFGEFVNPGAIPSFTEGQQKDLPMAVPPVEEQQAITRHIEHATEKTSTLTAEIARSIDLLRERRAALITAAVTGQIPAEEMRP